MKASVKEWLEFAKIDLLAAKRLKGEAALTTVVCFHAQQCDEKSIKALIEATHLNPPKTHDLIRLYGMVEDRVDMDEDILASLNQLYIDTRYPAAFGMMPNGAPEIEEANEFCEFADSVYIIVKGFLEESP